MRRRRKKKRRRSFDVAAFLSLDVVVVDGVVFDSNDRLRMTNLMLVTLAVKMLLMLQM